jgi:probable rRNA maturation factor
MKSEVGRRKSEVSIHYAVDGVTMPRFDRERVRSVVVAALKGQVGTLTVLFVSDKRATELHRQHFNDPTTTDVMTFPDGSPDPQGGTLLGDLAVCVPVARREARKRKRPMADELTLYILHGVLHLLGHDDLDERSRRAMWAAQRRLLARVGIALEAEPG